MKVQQLLIRWILEPVNKWLGRFPDKIRDWLFLVGGMGIVLQGFLNNMGLANYRFLIFFAIDCLFMGMMILGGMGTEIKPVKFNTFLSICWGGVGVMMLQSGLQNNVDYLPEAMLFLVAYPVLFLCWSSGDRERIFGLLLKLCRYAAWAFLAGSFLLIQIKQQRYAGLFRNTNMAAYFLAVVYVAVVLEVLYNPLSWKRAADILLLGLIAAMNFYTNSRTGTLGMIIGAGVAVVLYLASRRWKDLKACLTKIAICAVVSALCTSGLVYVFQLRAFLPLPYWNLKTQTFYFVDLPGTHKPPATDPSATDPSATEPDGSEPLPTDPTHGGFFGTGDFEDLNNDKTDHTDKTMDQYSTGRLSVWLAYAKDLNLFGHVSTAEKYIDILYRTVNSTHMTILQVAYESGALAGILYLLFNLATGILAIRYALKNPQEHYALVPLAFTLVFGVLSVLGSCGVSFWYFTTFVYYIVQFPILTGTIGTKEQKEEQK